jgi:hypothetical protein
MSIQSIIFFLCPSQQLLLKIFFPLIYVHMYPVMLEMSSETYVEVRPCFSV